MLGGTGVFSGPVPGKANAQALVSDRCQTEPYMQSKTGQKGVGGERGQRSVSLAG